MTEAAESTPAVADLLARARVYATPSKRWRPTPPTGSTSPPGVRSTNGGHYRRRPRRCRCAPTRSVIICYLVETADSYRVATLVQRLASISYHHKQARHVLPTKAPEVERTMRGIRRAKGMAPNGKAPLLPPQLRQAMALRAEV